MLRLKILSNSISFNINKSINIKTVYKNMSEVELDIQLREEFDKIGKVAKYGTAGFRDLATHMPYISYRVGIFVALLNKTQPSKCLGVVMSASHNKIEDNGLKITNFNGNMLEMRYESVLESFVANKNIEEAKAQLKKFLNEQGKTVFQCSTNVFIGGDTRPSTPQLLELVAKGIESQGCKVSNFKLTTTPQLQYYVYLYNNVLKVKDLENQQVNIEKIRPLFWQNFSSYYKDCINYLNDKTKKKRTIDCANGVGGKIMPHFQQELKQYFDIELINNTNGQNLNKKCGADFVKTQAKFPDEYQPRDHNSFLSFDGDADRIVFFIEQENGLKLIDGDRQGTIFTQFYKRISQQLKQRTQKLNLNSEISFHAPRHPSIGFVQTYYANYSSSEYLLKQYNMKPVYAATGVKFLHHKAEQFDVGVYFEANGHGTVIFNEQYLGKVQALLMHKSTIMDMEIVRNNQQIKNEIEEYYRFVDFYFSACKLANPSVGDAICNLLIFELALSYLKLDYADTLKLYTDLKSKTSKIAVKSKQNVKVTEMEDKVIEPQGLQDQIQEIIKKHGGKKAFLRPSGTENVLRLHVQAQTVELVQKITQQVTALVHKNPALN